MAAAPSSYDPDQEPKLPPAAWEPAFPANPAGQAADPEPAPVSRPTWGRFLRSRDFWLTIAIFIVSGIAMLALVLFVLLPLYTRHGDEVAVPKVTEVTLDRAELLLDARDLDLLVIDSQYIQGRPPLSVITQEPPAGQTVKRGRAVYLVVNKTTPPTTKMPDIVDVNLQQARYLLGNWGLQVGSLTYQAGTEPDLVLKASVSGRELRAGDPIQVGSRIDLVVSRTSGGEAIEVPDLNGLSLGEATNQLVDLGLSVGQIRFGTSPGVRTNGVVFQQSPLPGGSTVARGTPVDLWVTGTRNTPGEGAQPADN